MLHVLVALAIIGLVLLQHGKGADMGAAFGSGSSGSLFGAAGSANFLSRTTAVLAACSSLSSLGAHVSRDASRPVEGGGGVMDARRAEQPRSRSEKQARGGRRRSRSRRRPQAQGSAAVTFERRNLQGIIEAVEAADVVKLVDTPS